MNKHTAEPWAAKDLGNGIWINGPEDKGYLPVAHVGDTWEGANDRNKADAERIVACVNACAGMDDPAAEIALMRHAGERLSTDYANADNECGQLRAENARLRDALAARASLATLK